MSELLRFETREAFREWLSENCRRREGVWLEFGKTKEVETLSANDALLEALCFGWIDGVMKYILQEVFCAAKSWQQMVTEKQGAGSGAGSMRCHDGISVQVNQNL